MSHFHVIHLRLRQCGQSSCLLREDSVSYKRRERIVWLQRFALAMAILLGVALTAGAQNDYPLTDDSKPKPGVPQGRVEGPFQWKSRIYAGTVRDYWVYVPAQYKASSPACVLVVQDGIGRARAWHLPTVMDNLIHAGDMPVTIGIFIAPGIVPAPHENAQPRFNRSFEYDSLGDRYARFLLEEILPEVNKRYRLSDDPNDRAIAGASSGGICAFNVAWERPDAFRRVYSSIGTFVALRDGHDLPSLVRKCEPKPIRVYLQDGNHDLNIYAGDWWLANQRMFSALQWAGYDVAHAWGTGGHDSKQSAAITPEALRWLWRDYPKPIRRGATPHRRTDLLIPDEPWQLVGEGYRFTEGPAANARGEVFFTDVPESKIYRIDLQGRITLFAENTGGANGLMFGADGRLYACAGKKRQLVAYTPDGKLQVVAKDIQGNDLAITPMGIYVTEPSKKRVVFVGKDGSIQPVDTRGLDFPNGVVASPDFTQLYVADTRRQRANVYQIRPDGSLRYKEPMVHLHLAPESNQSGADGMCVDREGRLYVTTRLGLQVCDQLGRVQLILEKPQRAWLSNVAFGGPQFDTLYVTCRDKVYRRRIKAKGLRSGAKPIKPPKPRL